MNIVNFSITDPLAEKINKVISEWGFTSKAEFFRFIALSFIEREEMKKAREEQMFAQSAKELGETIKKKFKNKKIPPMEEQLADLI